MNKEYKTNRLIKEREILIVGPCSFKKDEIFIDLVKTIPVLAIDRGIDQIEGPSIALSLGDGDSSKLEMDIKFNPIKDKSDLELGLEFLKDSSKKIHLYGFIGERKDHEWINLGEIHRYIAKTQSTALLESSVLFIPKGVHKVEINGTFSLISLCENTISINGNCEYELNDALKIPLLSSRGLSNVGYGICEISCDSPLIIYSESKSLSHPKV